MTTQQPKTNQQSSPQSLRNKEEKPPTKEERMDKTLADSYPASDPPSSIPNPSDDPANPAEKDEDC